MFWVSSCSPLRYLCLCGWFFCTFCFPWHQGLFWVIVSSPSLTKCTAPVTHSSWTCTLEFAVLNNWSKLYVFYIQLEEEINPLSSVYQAVFVRKTFSMLELFTAPQAEIIKRLQSLCVSLSNSMTVHKLLMFLYFSFWVLVTMRVPCGWSSLPGCQKKEVKGHIQCAVILLSSSCYYALGSFAEVTCQDVRRTLLLVTSAVTYSAVNPCDSCNLCLFFFLQLLLRIWTFPFMLHSYQS